MKIGKCAMYLKLFKEGLEYLDKAENILRISLGEKHALLKEVDKLKVLANEDINIYLAKRLAAHKAKVEEQEKENRLKKILHNFEVCTNNNKSGKWTKC